MPDEKSNFAGERILCPFQHSDHAFVTQVVGGSMFNPSVKRSYSDGDFIVVDPDRAYKHESIVLAYVDGLELVRQVLMEPGDMVMLAALSPSWPDRVQKMKGGDSIIGTVIGKWVAEE